MGRLCRTCRGGKLRRHRMPQRNPRLGRRDSGAECRRLRTGGVRDDSRSRWCSIDNRCNSTTFNNAECGFGYRTSIFNTTERDRYIILRVTFALRRGGKTGDSLRRSAKGVCAERAPILRYRRCVQLYARFVTARRCSSSPAMTTLAARDLSSRIRLSLSITSKILRRACARVGSRCPVIPPVRGSANCPRHGWSNTPASPKGTVVVKREFPVDTRWRSSIAAERLRPTSSR